ncbi:MAG: hypothetical protein Kow0090_00050 [Myxococcota bacterium]
MAFLDAWGYSLRVEKGEHRDLFFRVLDRYIASISHYDEFQKPFFNSLGKLDIIEKGDARNMILEDNSIDGVITSPPYSFAIDYINNDRA